MANTLLGIGRWEGNSCDLTLNGGRSLICDDSVTDSLRGGGLANARSRLPDWGCLLEEAGGGGGGCLLLCLTSASGSVVTSAT